MNWIIGALREIVQFILILGCAYINLKFLVRFDHYFKRKKLVPKTGRNSNDKRKFILGIASIILAFIISAKIADFLGANKLKEDSKAEGLVIALMTFSIIPLTTLIYVPVAIRLGFYDKKREKDE